ncbi:winged helix-turn-helix domain-containing protein [Methanolobus sp. ZRKC3]|uniref:helix-turn-helix transcriptional regulator n=1 Tax=Methanolobus sp. ZRKC3 TaxID=3125786 RepID=UPI00324C27E4
MQLALLGTIFLSDKRKDLLLILIDGPMGIDDIKRELNVTTSAIMTQIKILIDHGLVVYANDSYFLSNFGEVIARKMLPLVKTLQVYSENMEYWDNHKFSAIPEPLQDRIAEIGSCSLVEPDLNRMYELPKDLEDNIAEAKSIMEVSSYFSPAYTSKYLGYAKRGVKMSLIVTEPVFERMRDEYKSILEEFISISNVDLYVYHDDIGLASCIVTDKFLSFALFFKNGMYHNHAMMGYEKSALKWGEALFEYFKATSLYVDGI